MQSRRLIVISGQEQSGLRQAQQLLRNFPRGKVLDRELTLQQVLGREHLAAIYNTWQGFDPDYLAALGGTIVAGGVLILLTPPLPDWPDFTDPYYQRMANWPYQLEDISGYYLRRFINKLQQADCVTLYRTENIPQDLQLALPAVTPKAAGFKTADQQQALTQIQQHLAEKTVSPIVIEADRGRGKSALLGMLAAQLMTLDPAKRIGITAPSKKTADVIFRHAGTAQQLCFIAPDELCHTLPALDLLLVDEAAAIPSSVLATLLRHYPNSIFSTTVHGYEGTGRGFALRFPKLLDKHHHNWLHIHLKQPIRYAQNDPLERFLFDSLLLNTAPQTVIAGHFTLDDCHYQTVTARQLINNESLLRQLFGLLVLAHYQTRPSDLRHLLDGKDVSIAVAMWQKQLIGAVLSVREGGFDQSLAHEIHYGLRRPQGHLVPQSLAVHAGIASAPLLYTQRIMRIVVHPQLRRQGIASMLLSRLREDAQKKQIDYLSSSFGATSGLLRFWKKQAYKPVRIGFNRDASSGCHSVIVIQPLSEHGKKLYQQARYQFKRMLPVLLEEPLNASKAELQELFKSTPHKPQEYTINTQDKADLESYAYGKRGYESCQLAIRKLVTIARSNPQIWNKLTTWQQQLVEEKVLKQTCWQKLAKKHSQHGKKQLQSRVREAVSLLTCVWIPEINSLKTNK